MFLVPSELAISASNDLLLIVWPSIGLPQGADDGTSLITLEAFVLMAIPRSTAGLFSNMFFSLPHKSLDHKSGLSTAESATSLRVAISISMQKR